MRSQMGATFLGQLQFLHQRKVLTIKEFKFIWTWFAYGTYETFSFKKFCET
jgi:hypothetical protein